MASLDGNSINDSTGGTPAEDSIETAMIKDKAVTVAKLADTLNLTGKTLTIPEITNEFIVRRAGGGFRQISTDASLVDYRSFTQDGLAWMGTVSAHPFRMYSSNGAYFLELRANGDLLLDSQGSAPRKGNLGLGITPTEKLHVSGNGIITGNLDVTGNGDITG